MFLAFRRGVPSNACIGFSRWFSCWVMGENDVCVVAATRTPIGCFQGALASVSATDLGSTAIAGALKQAKMDPMHIQEAFIGNVLSANLGQAPAKQACLKAGIPDSVPCTGVNKVCASGMKAVILGAQTIMTRMHSMVLVGGMESMSNVPHYLPQSRSGQKMGHFQCIDGMIADGLWDPYADKHMGSFAEECAREHQISREEQDDYAIQSFERAIAAANAMSWEITPVKTQDKKGNEIVVDKDEGIQRFNKQKLRQLKPAFESDGSVTAGNASQLSDGAAALILASRSKALELGLPVLASIVWMTDASQRPAWFTTTPSVAVKALLEMSSVKKDAVDLFEINEAFSVVALVNQRLLQLNPAKVNVWGGAVALGHPLGCSGARILVTLMNALRSQRHQYGVAAICNGGGGASSILIRNET